jgi:hypothetical protein
MFALDLLQDYPVNWIDGMRVSAKDFSVGDLAWQTALRDVRVTLLQGTQYGLLPSLRASNDSSSYPKFNYDAARSVLTLLECRAITEGGYRVEITEELHRRYQIPAALPSAKVEHRESFEVYITVDPSQPQAAGPESGVAPPRRLYVTPQYELSVLPKSDGLGLSGMNHLKIAEFRYQNGSFTLDDSYLPPCMTIATHAKLAERHAKAGGYLRAIHDNSVIFVNQYRLDNRPEVRDAAAWVERVVVFISQNLWTYASVLPQKSPFETLIFFQNLSQVVLTTAQISDNNGYISEALRKFSPVFKAVADPNFSSDDLQTAFNRADAALKGLYEWLKMLKDWFDRRVPPPFKVEKN